MNRRIEDPDTGCWTTGLKTTRDGYVRVYVPGEPRRSAGVHQLSYVINVGELDPMLEVMHKCHNPPCYRPDHLEQGSHMQNCSEIDYKAWERPRRAYCKEGHPLTGDNVMYSAGGTVRRCRTCRSAKMKVYKRTYRNKKEGE